MRTNGDNALTVSIHAPVRGATAPAFGMPGQRMVSIHAPVRGATTWRRPQRPVALVSIHAPVRGATCETDGNVVFYKEFRSTPP